VVKKDVMKDKKVKKEKKDTPFWKRFLIMLGLFILACVFYSVAASLFILDEWLWGLILFLLGITVNIFIFIKGRKGAAILGVFLLIGAIISIAGVSFFSFLLNGGKLQEISQIEQNQILENKSENIENLFYGFENKNYTAFSRDLNDKMRERYDKIAFSKLYSELGKTILKNCSTAGRTKTGDDVVLCEVESQNKKTSWDMRFSKNNTIWGLYVEDIYPNVTLTVKSENTANSINILWDNRKTELKAGENQVLLILDVSVKNNENKKIRIHTSKFLNEKYNYNLIEEDYIPTDCKIIRNVDIEAYGVKEGCLIFAVYEGYEEGNVTLM
jgi:hypothetical protein